MEWGGHVIDVNLINGIALAFEGDAVYSMYIRRHLILKGMTKPNKLHQEATKYVSAKAQAHLISLMLEVFGVIFVEEVLDEEIEALIQKRQEARANKDFATADQIRDQLAAQGIKLLDTKDGVRWTRDWCQSH